MKLVEEMGIDFDSLYQQEVEIKASKKKKKEKKKPEKKEPQMINYRPEITRAEI